MEADCWEISLGFWVQNHLISVSLSLSNFILICKKKSTKLNTVTRIRWNYLDEALSSLSCGKSSENGSYLVLDGDIIILYTGDTPLKHKYKYTKRLVMARPCTAILIWILWLRASSCS